MKLSFISDRLNLSASSISKALNNRADVSKEVKDILKKFYRDEAFKRWYKGDKFQLLIIYNGELNISSFLFIITLWALLEILNKYIDFHFIHEKEINFSLNSYMNRHDLDLAVILTTKKEVNIYEDIFWPHIFI